MKTDTYTKVILTFIALFLGVLAMDKIFYMVVPQAQAQEEVSVETATIVDCDPRKQNNSKTRSPTKKCLAVKVFEY